MNVKSQRQLQVGEQVKRIIADIFLRENLLVIGGTCVTILEADVSPDIKNARIYLDMFGNDGNHKKILDKLNLNSGHFRHQLGAQMSSRNTPELKFILDKTQDSANKIEALIYKEAKAIEKANKKPRKKKS